MPDKLGSDEKESRFEEGKPADPTKDMSEEDAKKWKVEHDKHKDEFKAASEDEDDEAAKLYHEAEEAYKKGRKLLLDGHLEQARVQSITVGELALKAQNKGLSKADYDRAIRARDALISAYHEMRAMPDKLGSDEKESRFEEGKPADPTKDMSEEDAKKWKVEHDKHEDKFKAASSTEFNHLKKLIETGGGNAGHMLSKLEEAFEARKITQAELSKLEGIAEKHKKAASADPWKV
jgi:transcriptional regulator with XRE-family HTH domain